MLGTVISNYLHASGRSARSLAIEVGVSNTVLSRWQNNVCQPGSGETLLKLLDVVGADKAQRAAVFSERLGVAVTEISTAVGVDD